LQLRPQLTRGGRVGVVKTEALPLGNLDDLGDKMTDIAVRQPTLLTSLKSCVRILWDSGSLSMIG
jgi:hypothetical protein